MERCILGSSRDGAWVNVKKITPKSFDISQIMLFFVVNVIT